MKYILIIVIFLIKPLQAQEKYSLNFIVTVDDMLMNSLSNFAVVPVNFSEGDTPLILLGYQPGNLTLTKSEFSRLYSDDFSSEVILSFTAGYYIGKKYVQSFYSIPINKNLLKKNYCILAIENLTKKSKRKKQKPLYLYKDYRFRIDLPEYSIYK